VRTSKQIVVEAKLGTQGAAAKSPKGRGEKHI
jgi:hypothetical protein